MERIWSRARSREALTPLLLVLTLLTGLVALAAVPTGSHIPPAWPVAGLATGLYLTTSRRHRPWVLGAVGGLVLLAHTLHGYPLVVAAGYATWCVAETWVVRRALLRGGTTRATLLDDGDVSRLIGAVALGAAVAAGGFALTDAATGRGEPLLTAVAVWGTHAAALMVLLPLFLPTPSFAPLARGRERLVQALLTVGTSALLFSSASLPLLVFVVMPMFAWLAFRGTLREATALLVVVALLGTTLTALGIGPVWGLGERYDLAPDLVTGVMQLFLIDCGLIMLPLTVTVTQQRLTAARDAAGRETMERLIASATGIGIIATDTAGRITLFNPGAEAMLGWSAEQVRDRSPSPFLSEVEVARHARELGCAPQLPAVLGAVVASGQPRRLWHFTRRDGEQRAVLATVTALPGDRGELAGYLCTGEDITEREAAQEALVLALRRLQELDEVKSNFVATVSHELRTPITSIMGYTELLEDGAEGPLNEGQAALVGRVDRNSRRLLRLIEDLLTLSRIESSDLTVDRVRTDAAAIVLRANDAIAASLAARDLQVVLEVPHEPLPLDGDPVQLERMVINLLTNAVKFTPDGGRITVSLCRDDDRLHLTIADTGLGIPEHEQDRLFTRFFRSSTATTLAIQGTGLGLSIVHAIVTLHDGEIAVSSTEGVGTAVHVTLPSAVPAAPGAEAAARATPMGHPGGVCEVSAS